MRVASTDTLFTSLMDTHTQNHVKRSKKHKKSFKIILKLCNGIVCVGSCVPKAYNALESCRVLEKKRGKECATVLHIKHMLLFFVRDRTTTSKY